MKKRKLLNKTIVSLLAISMSIFLFAGCQSNNSSAQAASNSTQSNRKNGNRMSPEQIKQRVQDSIKPLVTADTITQAQADKIVEAYTTGTNGNGQNSTQNNQQNSQQNNQQSNQQGNSQAKGQNRQRYNPLSKLVSDGVITQPQADEVMEKMRGNLNQRNNGQNSQNNNNQSSN
jgi:hypothetical protein